MTEFLLNTKKEKIEIEYASKELKDKIKKEIEKLMDSGFNKNTSKAIVLIDLLKNNEYQESISEKGYVLFSFPSITV